MDEKFPFGYALPKCPACAARLAYRSSPKVILSDPPSYIMKCSKCDFDGWVQLEHKKRKRKPIFEQFVFDLRDEGLIR